MRMSRARIRDRATWPLPPGSQYVRIGILLQVQIADVHRRRVDRTDLPFRTGLKKSVVQSPPKSEFSTVSVTPMSAAGRPVAVRDQLATRCGLKSEIERRRRRGRRIGAHFGDVRRSAGRRILISVKKFVVDVTDHLDVARVAEAARAAGYGASGAAGDECGS